MAEPIDSVRNLKTFFELLGPLLSNSSFNAICKDLEENDSLKEQLARQAVRLNTDRDTFTDAIADLRTKLKSEVSKTTEQASQLSKLEDSEKSLTSSLMAEKAKVVERDAKIRETEKINSELQEQLTASRVEVERLNGMIRTKDARHNELSFRFEITSKELKDRHTQVGTLTEQLMGLKKFSCEMKRPGENEM